MSRTTWLLAIALAVGACGKSEGKKPPLGAPMPSNTPSATIEQVTKDKSFVGRTVAVEGRVGGVGCADCGGVLVTDKTWRLLVEPQDKTKFQIPPNSGARVRVWGVVDVEDDEGEEHEAKEAAGGEAQEKHEKTEGVGEAEKKDGEAEKKEGEGGNAHAKLHKDLNNIALKAKGVEWL